MTITSNFSLNNWQSNSLNSTLISAQPVPAEDDTSFENPQKFSSIENIDKLELDWLSFECIKEYFSVRNSLKSFKEGRKLHLANHLRQIGFSKVSMQVFLK